jgi:hypothetical protein
VGLDVEGRLGRGSISSRWSDPPSRRLAPFPHAASQTVRRELYAFYAEFVAAYREASEKFRAGNRTVRFPLGSFPPALPFVAG